MSRHLRALEPHERIIGWRLTEGRVTFYDELIGALWGDREDGGAEWAIGSIKVRISDLRRALAPFGIAVRNVYGRGYQVAAADTARLRDLLADEIERNVRIDRRNNARGTGSRALARTETRALCAPPSDGAAP